MNHMFEPNSILVFLADVAEQVFNRCMLDNKLNVENIDYQITFNYEFLDDLYSILTWAEKGSSDSGSSSGNVKVANFKTPFTFAVFAQKLVQRGNNIGSNVQLM